MGAGRPPVEMKGRAFGDLTAIDAEQPSPNGGGLQWRFRCSCGRDDFIADGAAVRRGRYKHCDASVHRQRPPPPPKVYKPGWGPRGRLVHDLTGQRFGFLVALSEAPPSRTGTMWLCECSRCPERRQKVISAGSLKNGTTKSCGCLPRGFQAFRAGEG